MSTPALPQSIDDTVARLTALDYVPSRELATTVFLALKLQRPLFLEGEPGTGKTEIARTLATMLGRPLIRLQCFEGLDLAQAAYEWNYPRQLLELQAARAGEVGARSVFTEAFLLKRPLLQAIDAAHRSAPVLLIDELDRADEEFESFLLELLSDFQLTIPELGTLKAVHRPVVVLTSNRTRDVHDALKRRCVYHWIDYPSEATEVDIVGRQVPGLPEAVRRQVVAFVQRLRLEELAKVPGVAETVDWAQALTHLDAVELTPEAAEASLGVLLKSREDIARVRGGLARSLLGVPR